MLYQIKRKQVSITYKMKIKIMGQQESRGTIAILIGFVIAGSSTVKKRRYSMKIFSLFMLFGKGETIKVF